LNTLYIDATDVTALHPKYNWRKSRRNNKVKI